MRHASTFVSCAADCGALIDADRALLGCVGKQDFALCVACNVRNLTPPPMREGRSNATYDPHGHHLQGRK